MANGTIHSFESFATLDGTGIRFAVFFQGCNLSCVYCHNPDTQKHGGGTPYTAEELLTKILRYKPYFKKNGGVTLTGGEPLLQAEFITELCKLLKENNIDIALDTSASILNESVKKLIPLIDHFIVDLKFFTEEDYQKYTKGSLKTTLEFLELLRGSGKKVWLRTVIMPNLNDKISDIDRYFEIAKRFDFVDKYELLGFHTMGFEKYEKLCRENPLEGTLPLEQNKLKELQGYLDSLYRNEKNRKEE